MYHESPTWYRPYNIGNSIANIADILPVYLIYCQYNTYAITDFWHQDFKLCSIAKTETKAEVEWGAKEGHNEKILY